MTMRPVFFILAVVSFLGALLVWRNRDPGVDAVFSGEFTEISGKAAPYTRQKGTKQVLIETGTGKTYFIDCLALVPLCNGKAGGTPFDIEARVARLSTNAVWPITAKLNGREVLTAEVSKERYELHADQDGGLYRLPLLMGLAFVGFGIWFGNRSATP